MNIRKLLDDYTECNNFEIKILEDKISIFYYDKIDYFDDKKIVALKKNKYYEITGNFLVIETMFKEFIVIKGDVQNIKMGIKNE